jgi:hypothetical protein
MTRRDNTLLLVIAGSVVNSDGKLQLTKDNMLLLVVASSVVGGK